VVYLNQNEGIFKNTVSFCDPEGKKICSWKQNMGLGTGGEVLNIKGTYIITV